MDQLGDILEWQTTSGKPTTVGRVTVTPQARALTIRWPHGGIVWNRPVAVLVERDGETERLPIVDATRAAQMRFLGFGLIFSIIAFTLSARSRRNGK